MANSLELDPEWAQSIFSKRLLSFGTKIANEEAEGCGTVHDLLNVVCAHPPDWDSQEGNCGSSIMFYRLRRSLNTENKRGVAPGTAISFSRLLPSLLFKKLAVETGLRLPSPELTWLQATSGFLETRSIHPASTGASSSGARPKPERIGIESVDLHKVSHPDPDGKSATDCLRHYDESPCLAIRLH
jgi:hypothetical protein